jgi:tryptophan synthase alpha chain
MDRLNAAFAAAKDAGRGALIIYVCAGDPSLDATAEIVVALERAGADVVELGVPYSDPIADGPTIQAAAARALKAGAKVAGVLACAARIRERSQIPLVIMSSVSPLFRFGLERFAAEAAAAGVDGVLLSDLPPEESGEWNELARRNELKTVFLVSPNTPPERVAKAAAATTGFVYAVSHAGVTGARSELPPHLKELVGGIRKVSERPVAIGFGISTAAHVRQVWEVADGAIVGSAVVKVIAANAQNPAPAAAEFVRGLLG